MIKKPVVALVTAYNEEVTIGNVLDVLKKCPSIDRIQVVDDGSTDRTREIALAKKVKCITLPKRIPVGKAIMHHLTTIKEKDCTLLWCDADLLNLTVEHIETILRNMKGEVTMSIGQKDNLPFLPIIATNVLPRKLVDLSVHLYSFFDMHVGGERAIHKSVFEQAIKKSNMANGYGIVVLLNWYCRKYTGGYKVEVMPKLTHRNKYAKWGWKGLLELPGEIFQFFTGYIKIRMKIHRDVN